MNQVTDSLLLQQPVDKGYSFRQEIVKNDAAGGGDQQLVVLTVQGFHRTVGDILGILHVGVQILDVAKIAQSNHCVDIHQLVFQGVKDIFP